MDPQDLSPDVAGKYKTVHVTAKESAETALNVLETLVEAAAQQLAQDVLLDIFTEITAAKYGVPGIPALAATNFDYKKVLNLRESCGNAKMPPNPRALVLDAGYYTNLLADDVVAKSFNLNLNVPAVTEGMVKRIAGFALHETTILPANHAEKLVGFAAHSSAMAVAMRYLQPVADYQQAGAVTDPQTGMTFGYLRFTDTRRADCNHDGPPPFAAAHGWASFGSLVLGWLSLFGSRVPVAHGLVVGFNLSHELAGDLTPGDNLDAIAGGFVH